MLKLDVFEKLASADLIENGAWMQFKDAEGEPLYRDAEKTKPCRALVRSYRCKAFRAFSVVFEARNSGKVMRAKDIAKDEINAKIATSRRPKWVSVLLNGLENCSPDPGLLHLTEADVEEFCAGSANQIAIDQILEFAFEDKNYGEAAKNPQLAGAEASEG